MSKMISNVLDFVVTSSFLMAVSVTIVDANSGVMRFAMRLIRSLRISPNFSTYNATCPDIILPERRRARTPTEQETPVSKRSSIRYATQSNMTCGLVKEAYHIPFSDPNYHIQPTCIDVTKCGGPCCAVNLWGDQTKECVATKTNTVKTYVKKYDIHGNGPPQPHLVKYENATECQCRCKLQDSDCSGLSTVDQNSCQCICNVQNKTCPPLKTWSHVSCACVCRSGQTSTSCPSTDLEWNPSTCSCEKKKRQTCPSGKYLNSSLCCQ